MKVPYYKCDKRRPGCHQEGRCNEYDEYVSWNREFKERLRQDKKDDYYLGYARRLKKKK